MTDFSFQDFQLLKKSILFFSFGSCQRENLLILRAPYARFLQTCCLATKDLPLDLASFASFYIPLSIFTVLTFSLLCQYCVLGYNRSLPLTATMCPPLHLSTLAGPTQLVVTRLSGYSRAQRE